MPPKKRGRPPGLSATASSPTKRVRVGETSIIGKQNSTQVTDSGRVRRSSVGEPNYTTKRAKNPNKPSSPSSKTPTAGKATAKRRRKGASKLFGKRRPLIAAKDEPEATATLKRKPGRPKGTKGTTTAAVEKEAAKAPKNAIGRPRKALVKPKKAAGRPKKIVEDVKSTKARAAKPKGRKAFVNHEEGDDQVEGSDALSNGTSNDVVEDDDGQEEDETEASQSGRQYWLMKAEPESRAESGVDVKFSIDDLRARGGAEAWDGVRNYGARNNLRAMRKGDLAFFYHSNCKVPGIAGVMEIVEEHRIDETAFEPGHPYFDPNSTRENPKWDVVHVQFVRKFPEIIRLTDLRTFAKPGGVLEKMQLLKQGRLSVSAVTAKEWSFILSLAEDDRDEDNAGPVEETLVDTVNGTKGSKDSKTTVPMDEEAEENDDREEDEDSVLDTQWDSDMKRENGDEGADDE